MGIAKDLGKCKGVRKSDNRPCTNFVNRYMYTCRVIVTYYYKEQDIISRIVKYRGNDSKNVFAP